MAEYVIRAEYEAPAKMPTLPITPQAGDAILSVLICGSGDSGTTAVNFRVQAADYLDAETEGARLAEVYAAVMTLPAEAKLTVREAANVLAEASRGPANESGQRLRYADGWAFRRGSQLPIDMCSGFAKSALLNWSLPRCDT